MIDELEARSEMSAMFYNAWLSFDWLIMEEGQPPTILWEGRGTDIPQNNVAWIRFTVQPTDSEQSSLAGADSTRKYTNEGIISVQAFGPMQWDDGYEVAEYMGIMAKRVYQGKASPSGIWFRNCRTNRVGPSDGWYQFNTIIEYQYDEQR